jgi:hypothetical protein
VIELIKTKLVVRPPGWPIRSGRGGTLATNLGASTGNRSRSLVVNTPETRELKVVG